jgi:prevent-host-death family protein
MIQIRPVSDLRNKFPDIEKIVNTGEPVYLTKNGYGAMVVLSLDMYSRLTDGVEAALDEADRMAEKDSRRMNHEEVFGSLRRKINAQ